MNKESFNKKCEEYLCNYVPLDTSVFVAGGIFPRLYHDLPVRDIDVYVNNSKDFEKAKKEYERVGFIPVDGLSSGIPEGVEFCNFKSPEDGVIIDLIGFHKPRNGYVDVLSGAFDCIVSKEIKINSRIKLYKNFNNNTLTRLKKYLDLGFTISDEELSKIYKILIKTDFKKLDSSPMELKTRWQKVKQWIDNCSVYPY
jgi:hypothetical protein